MKWIIVGSRTIDDKEYIFKKLNEFESFLGKPEEVVTGGARGVDTLAYRWAASKHFLTRLFYPDWNKYGKSAGVLRNAAMADYVCQFDNPVLILIWDGESKGSYAMRKIAMERNINVYEIVVRR